MLRNVPLIAAIAALVLGVVCVYCTVGSVMLPPEQRSGMPLIALLSGLLSLGISEAASFMRGISIETGDEA